MTYQSMAILAYAGGMGPHSWVCTFTIPLQKYRADSSTSFVSHQMSVSPVRNEHLHLQSIERTAIVSQLTYWLL